MARTTLPSSILTTRIPVRGSSIVLGAVRELAIWLGTLPTTIQLAVTLDFPNTLAQTSSALPVTIKGVRKGDGVLVSPDPTAILANSHYSAEVTDLDEVTVRFHNYSALAQNPPEAPFNLYVFHQ